MKKSIKSNAILVLILVGIGLSSCERDEILIVEPIKIDVSCDTTNVSFSKTVFPLLTDCVPCHNNSTKYAGINLEGYDKIKSEAMKGSLTGSLRSSMSNYFSSKDCDYVKIQAWINQGSKNN